MFGRRSFRVVGFAGVLAITGLVVGCSGGDAGAPTSVTASDAPSATPGDVAAGDATTSPPDTGGAPTAPTASPSPTDGDPDAPGVTDATDGTDPGDEIGVPGLDSDELVCRSWSRFAGSFQVVAVSAAFGGGEPLEVAGLEVLASPVVVGAYEELVEHWPDELADEADAVADRFLGPYARRSQRALDALVGAGARPADIEALAGAWLDALAERDPGSPVVTVDVPDDIESLVAAAAADFDAQVPPLASDPSLVTDVAVPATDAFLASTCPDGGALGGREVPG